jgi:small redox-active disulfide protein 2
MFSWFGQRLEMFLSCALFKKIMQILILGGLGTDCRQLENVLSDAIAELGIRADIGKVSSIRQMAAYGVSRTPALIIDGKIICEGEIPSKDMIKRALAQE